MPSAPKPPDPMKTAQAQGEMNRSTAISQYLLGATNQVTPFGSLEYTSLGSWGDNLAGTGSPGLGVAQPAAPAQPANTQPARANTKITSQDGAQQQNAQRQNAATTRGGAGQFMDEAYDVPRFQVKQTLAPDLQATVDNYLSTAKSLSGTMQATLGQPFDASGLPARSGAMTGGQGLQNVPVNASWSGPDARYTIDNAGAIQKDIGPNDFSADRLRVEDAMFSRLNPQFERDQSRQEADLIARGIRPGSKAYDNARDEMNRSLTDARLQTVLAGGQEQSRLSGLELNQGQFRNAAQQQQYGQNANDAQFYNSAQAQNFGQSMTMDQFARDGMGINNNTQNLGFNQQLAAGQFNNQNRGGALEEAMALRSLSMNEINALLSGTQIAGPKFQTTPQPGVAGVDYTGLVNSQYEAQLKSSQGLMGGLAGIGKSIAGGLFSAGGLLGASDRRLKTDIQRIGALDNGLGIYSYTYVWGGPRQIGVMADEVEQIMPEAVSDIANGFKGVDYGMIAEAA